MFTLGRKIELRHLPNLIIVILTLVTATIGRILTGEILSGLSIGGGVFLTWALSRELDPKHDYSAFVAAAISLFLLFSYDTIQFLVVAWILLLLRMTNGISGKKVTLFDIVSVLALTIYLSFSEQISFYLIPFCLAMVYFVITRERTGLALGAGGVALTLFIAQTFSLPPYSFNRILYTVPLMLIVYAILLLSFIIFWFISQYECQDDEGHTVNKYRLLFTEFLFSLTILLLFFFGRISLNNLTIYLSVIIGLTLYHTVFLLFRKTED